MIPDRFRSLRPYLASLVHPRFARPPVGEMVRWFGQPSKASRANGFIESKQTRNGFLEIKFKGFSQPFFYPESANWLQLCQTIDEVFSPENWHHFISRETPITAQDVVVDCGAAEGLFSFFAQPLAAKIYAIEPVPFWYQGLNRTFSQFSNVELLQVGVGHRNSEMRMTDREIYSRVSSTGELSVPVCTLDSLFAEKGIRVSFLKADIEGFEFRMLLGAEELIRVNRPKISITVYHDANHVPEVEEFLRNIHQDYRFKTRGIARNGNPVLFQAF